ncbi:hypothetical protein PENSPDRAFT_758988 [Peniophora sp. CONT]|nr:hypothetical protein PENSPDRAFT_758988 [Peniophora sp. CONT]
MQKEIRDKNLPLRHRLSLKLKRPLFEGDEDEPDSNASKKPRLDSDEPSTTATSIVPLVTSTSGNVMAAATTQAMTSTTALQLHASTRNAPTTTTSAQVLPTAEQLEGRTSTRPRDATQASKRAKNIVEPMPQATTPSLPAALARTRALIAQSAPVASGQVRCRWDACTYLFKDSKEDVSRHVREEHCTADTGVQGRKSTTKCCWAGCPQLCIQLQGLPRHVVNQHVQKELADNKDGGRKEAKMSAPKTAKAAIAKGRRTATRKVKKAAMSKGETKSEPEEAQVSKAGKATQSSKGKAAQTLIDLEPESEEGT